MRDDHPRSALLTYARFIEAVGWAGLPADTSSDHVVVRVDADTVAHLVCYADGVTLERVYTERGGVQHGFELLQHQDGDLYFSIHRRGLEHGTSVQYFQGVPIGAYSMHDGTGVVCVYGSDGALHELEGFVAGVLDGVAQRWSDGGFVYQEEHNRGGRRHGIHRAWDFRDATLRDGFPRFYLEGERVDRKAYVAACRRDPTLPPYRLEDDAADRDPPPRHPLTDVPSLDAVFTRLIPASLARG